MGRQRASIADLHRGEIHVVGCHKVEIRAEMCAFEGTLLGGTVEVPKIALFGVISL